MIHTKELRAGNKVCTPIGDVITVQQILSNTVVYDSKIEVQREVINIKGNYATASLGLLNEVVKEADCQDIEPIQLTEDILRKCGFRNYLREQWILHLSSGSNLDWEFLDGKLRLRSPAPNFAYIYNLHQLQNFIFAVANVELEVKLQ